MNKLPEKNRVFRLKGDLSQFNLKVNIRYKSASCVIKNYFIL